MQLVGEVFKEYDVALRTFAPTLLTQLYFMRNCGRCDVFSCGVVLRAGHALHLRKRATALRT